LWRCGTQNTLNPAIRSESVDARLRREELAKLADREKLAGCKLANLIDAYKKVSEPTKLGVPVEQGKPARMSKLLRKQGHAKVTTPVLSQWIELLRKYEPGKLPRPPKPPDPGQPPPNVVPFKR
jgi:hypothetical protein